LIPDEEDIVKYNDNRYTLKMLDVEKIITGLFENEFPEVTIALPDDEELKIALNIRRII